MSTNEKPSTEKQSLDNHANQLNPAHPAYHLARGMSQAEAEKAAADARTNDAKKPGSQSR